MSKQKRFASILAGVMAAVLLLTLLLTALPTVSASKSESQIKSEIDALESQKAQIDAKINGIQAQINANMSEIEKIVAEKYAIEQEIALLYEKMNAVNEQINAYTSLIADKQQELDDAMARLNALKIKYRERIRAMEENGTVSYWSVLFKANSFSDLLDRLNMIEEIASSDQRRLEEIRIASEEVKQAKAELEAKKTDLEATRVELQDLQKELEVKQAEVDKMLEALLAKGAEFDKWMEEAEKEASAMSSQINALEGQLSALEKEKYDQWVSQQPSGGNNVGGVGWKTPINYTAFTSAYGWRDHPIGGDRRFHYGVDLAAPSGTPIYATRSGVVSYTGWYGSGGNTVKINHQDGYISTYMHMTNYVVSTGQYVAQGQIIGYCGSTGGSTGPHLHFEIAYNGSTVNPANYISIR